MTKKRISTIIVAILLMATAAFILYTKAGIPTNAAEEVIKTANAYITIAVLIAAAVLFMLEIIPIAITAMFIPVVLTITGVLDGKAAFSGLSNDTVVLFGGMFVVGAAMFETGLANLIGNKVIKISKGSEIKLTLGIILTATALSSVLSNTGTVAVLLPVCLGIADSAGWNRARLLMPLAIMASVGGMITMVGTPPNMTVNAVLDQFGETQFAFIEYAKFGIPMSIVATIYLLTIGRKLLPNREIPKDQSNKVVEGKVYSKRKQIISGIILASVILVMAFEIIPLHVAAVLGALICIVTGCLTEKESYAGIDWSTIFLFAGALSLATALEKTGAGAIIAGAIVNAMGQDVSPYVLLTVMFFVANILTQFMSNTASAALLAPIGIQIAYTLSINPHAVLMTIAIAASAAFMTPVATPPNTLVYGPGNFRFMDYVKVGTPLVILTYIVAMLIIPFFWPFVLP